jgi:hypothetical protein
MITLNVAFLKAALLFASDEETRYYLKGVHLLRRADHLRITATDGHRLFCAMQTLDEPGDDFDIILPRDGLKKALTGLHRATEFLGLDLEWQSTVTLNPIKRATLNDVSMHPIDGTFPDVARVVPDAGSISGEVAFFNPLYLADIGKAAKTLGSGAMDFHLGYNGESPALITFGGTGSTFGEAFAVLMPYRCRVNPIHSAAVADIIGRDAPAADEKAA